MNQRHLAEPAHTHAHMHVHMWSARAQHVQYMCETRHTSSRVSDDGLAATCTGTSADTQNIRTWHQHLHHTCVYTPHQVFDFLKHAVRTDLSHTGMLQTDALRRGLEARRIRAAEVKAGLEAFASLLSPSQDIVIRHIAAISLSSMVCFLFSVNCVLAFDCACVTSYLSLRL